MPAPIKLDVDTFRRTLLGQARKEFADKAGPNKKLSLEEQKALPQDLRKMVETVRANKHATPTVNDAMEAYASYTAKVLAVVNRGDRKTLSAGEIAQIQDPALRKRAENIWNLSRDKFECKYGDSGNTPDLSIFPSRPAQSEVVGSASHLFSGSKYNPDLAKAGLSREACRALRGVLQKMCDQNDSGATPADFDLGEIRRLYDAAGKAVGFEVHFDFKGAEWGSLYVTNANKATYGSES